MTTSISSTIDTFVKSYREFEDHHVRFSRENPNRNPNQPACLMFGLTGTGKSAFLARLMSQKSPEDFMSTVVDVKNSEGFVIENGVMVGNRMMASTTLIPKGYLVGDLHLYDMPGFDDHDPNRRLVISVLNKCLLTRIHNTKFIVALGIDVFRGNDAAQRIMVYVKAFEQLFGEAYNQGMNHLFFVLTKNDTVGMQAPELNAAIMNMMIGVAKLNNFHASALIGRMSQFHVVADYKTWTSHDAINALAAMVQREQAGAQEQLHAKSFNVQHLEADETELTVKCDAELESLKRTIASRISEFAVLRDSNNNELAGSESGLKKMVEQYAADVKKLEETYLTLERVEQSRGAYQDERKRLSDEIVAQGTKATFCREQLNLLADSLKGFENVNFRCDVAQHYPGGIVGAASYKVDLIVDLNHHKHQGGQSIVVITNYEVNDTTLRNHIRSEEPGVGDLTLHPNNLNTITKFVPNIVLYHSTRAVDKINNPRVNGKSATVTSTEKEITIKVQMPTRFKVFVYYSTKFTDTPEYAHLQRQWEVQLQAASKRMSECTEALAKLDAKHQADGERRVDLKAKIATAEAQLRESAAKLDEQRVTLELLGRQKMDQSKGFKTYTEPSTYPSITAVQDVSGIYVKNHLSANHITAKLAEVHDQLLALSGHIQAATGEIDRAMHRMMATIAGTRSIIVSVPPSLKQQEESN